MIINIAVILLAIILSCYAAYCYAIMDTVSDCDEVHVQASIYADKNPLWYNKTKSWVLKHDRKLWLANLPKGYGILKVLPFSDSLSDEWHLRKTLSIFCMVGAIAVMGLVELKDLQKLLIIPIFVVIGVAMNVTFSYFYNKKLKRKI